MKFVFVAFGAMVGILVAAITITDLFVPEKRAGRAEVRIDATPDEVLTVLENVKAQPSWREDVAAVKITPDGWIETSKSGEAINFSWTMLNRERAELTFSSDFGYTGLWSARLTQEQAGTLIEVVEEVSVPNPFRRLVARVFFDPTAFSKRYLAALKQRVETDHD